MISFLRSFISRRRSQRMLGRKGYIGTRKRLTQDDTLATAAERSIFLAVIMLIAVWCVCVAILTLRKDEVEEVFLVENQRAPNTIFADVQFPFEDAAATEAMRAEVRNKVPLYYKVSSYRITHCLDLADRVIAVLAKRYKATQGNQVLEPEEKGPENEILGKISPAGLAALYHLVESPEQQEKYVRALSAVLENGIMGQHEKDNRKVGQNIRIVDARNRVYQERAMMDVITPELAAAQLSSNILKYYSGNDRGDFLKALKTMTMGIIGDDGDLTYYEKMTEDERQAVEAKVNPVVVPFIKDQPIVRKNDIIAARTLEILKQYRQALKESRQASDFWERFLRVAVICFLLMTITGIYIYHIHPEVVRSNQKIWVIGTTVIVAVMCNYAALFVFDFLSPALNLAPRWNKDVIPLALASVLLSVTIGLRVAVYAGFFVSVIAAIMLGDSFELVLKGMIVSSIAGFSVRHATNYKAFFFRILLTVFICWILLDNQLYMKFSFSVFTPVYAGVNAIITAIAALLLLFLLEFTFNVSTNMALLMLCDYNHPLLKQLQLRAPGTFHHSLMVATLAEQAAVAINANPIKARVGALFHDIGKLMKPEYFTENNAGNDKHRELHPRMSSLIILNHVKEGVDMAIKYKLKKIIRDTIEQHHGTDIVFYFYKRALEESPDTPVMEGEYRYHGPLPHEKEVVVVSLADACEAASRSLQKPTPAKIEALVWELIRKRVRDRQLDDADMTIRELATVRDSFVKTLTMMLHGRIAYPKDESDNEDDLFLAGKKIPSAEATPTKTDD